MKIKARKDLEEGSLVRSTVEGVFTNLDPERWFLSLESCLLQVVGKPQGGIAAGEEIEVRVVPDHRSLESEIRLLEKIAARARPEQPSDATRSEDAAFVDDLSSFSHTLGQYTPSKTSFLSSDEQARYGAVMLRTAELMRHPIVTTCLDSDVAQIEDSITQELDAGNLCVGRESDLGVRLLKMRQNTEYLCSVVEEIPDLTAHPALKESRRYLERRLFLLRKVVKKGMIRIKRACAEDLPEMLRSFDHFSDTFTEYKAKLATGADKKHIAAFHKERLSEHYVVLIDGNIVGGLRLSAPTEEDRVHIATAAGKKEKGTEKNVMITGFGIAPRIDEHIARVLGEVHLCIPRDLAYWRVYTGIAIADVTALESLGRGKLTAHAKNALRPIHAAMIDAGFTPFKARQYTSVDARQHNLGNCTGELLYRSKAVDHHPGRSKSSS